MRKAARWLALAVVAATGVFGSINAFDELGDGDTLLQRSVGAAVALYAALSWVILVATWRRRAWGVPVAVVWSLATIWAATMGSYAWGHAPWGAVVAAGASCVLLGVWIVWAVRESVSAQSPPPVASPDPHV